MFEENGSRIKLISHLGFGLRSGEKDQAVNGCSSDLNGIGLDLEDTTVHAVKAETNFVANVEETHERSEEEEESFGLDFNDAIQSALVVGDYKEGADDGEFCVWRLVKSSDLSHFHFGSVLVLLRKVEAL
ncbi:Protein transport protein SEC31-like protein B [Raphanus sativus]|nr:Protein transport protein SEC31-like protein B [Raphanus sativus]